MTDGVELTNPERRMLRSMLVAPSEVHTLDRIMDACDWNDQAVAVGAGQGLCDKGVVEIQRRFEEQSTQVKRVTMRLQTDCLKHDFGRGFRPKMNPRWPNFKQNLSVMRPVLE